LPRTAIATTAVVISGTWYFGYGLTATDSAKRALPQGSF